MRILRIIITLMILIIMVILFLKNQNISTMTMYNNIININNKLMSKIISKTNHNLINKKQNRIRNKYHKANNYNPKYCQIEVKNPINLSRMKYQNIQ
jgi:hypothetical protein